MSSYTVAIAGRSDLWSVARMEEVKETLLKVQEAVASVQGRGAIIEPTLYWVESKKENGITTTELYELIDTVVEASEIHLAKETLSTFVREKRPIQMQEKKFQGVVISRKGHKKTETEIDDILKMLEWLDEAGAMPILVMTSKQVNKMPRRGQVDEEDIGMRLGRMEEVLKAMDKKVENYNCELKREIYSIKPSYASFCRELSGGVQSGQVPTVVQSAGGAVHGVQGGMGDPPAAQEPMDQGQPQLNGPGDAQGGPSVQGGGGPPSQQHQGGGSGNQQQHVHGGVQQQPQQQPQQRHQYHQQQQHQQQNQQQQYQQQQQYLQQPQQQ